MPLKDIGKFTIQHLSILNEKGVVDKKLEPDLGEEELLHLYSSMVLAREADQRMLRLQRQGRLGTFSPCTGQEAGACGPALAMAQQDYLIPSFRELGALLMRGVPLHRVLLFWGGYEEGNVFEGVENTLPMYVIVGSQVAHAVGMAYGLRYQGKKDSTVVSFFGDGATSEGDVHEAFNFSGVWNTPNVFLCMNNQWAISTPVEMQTAADSIAQKAIAYGIYGIQVDGNDALAMYQATKDAIARARSGKGSTLIEAVTYRLSMHTTADDPSKYRDEAEVEPWHTKDPLTRFSTYLKKKNLWNDTKEEELRTKVKQAIDDEVAIYEKGVDAKPDVLFDHVYGTRHEQVEKQREEFLSNLHAKESADA